MNMRQRKFAIFLATSFFWAASALAQQAPEPAQPAPNAVTTKDASDAAKTKKVWTDDDVRHGSGGAGASVKNAKATGKPTSSKDSQAAKLKEQLTKLQAQLDDTNAKIAELQKFNGEYSADSGIKTNHHMDRASVEEQIAKLESKKKQLQEQIQNIYDEARHIGIEPGALR